MANNFPSEGHGEMNEQEGITGEYCEWYVDDEDYWTWASSCGGGPFCFTDGGPIDNGMTHCCYCGKRLTEA